MTDAQMQAWLDQEDELVAQTSRKHGQFIQYVSGGDEEMPPMFGYTVGLFGLGHPELVACSLGTSTTVGVLNHLGARIRAGENLLPGMLLTFEDWTHRVTVETIPNPGEILFAANRHYQRPMEASVPAYQLTYDDLQGRFPWDPGYSNAAHCQPRPGSLRT